MHGRPRDYKHKLRDPKAQEAYSKKVEAIRNGTALILQCRKLKRYDEAVMTAAAKLLKVVPEIYTIWNFRREALGEVLAAGGQAGKAASDTELLLTQACLMENPKSYSTWHHRKWVVSFGLCSLETELQLVTRALNEDSRNFHAWNYRQFLVRRMGRPLSEELAYSEDKIAQNFSNYSAWHYRTILLHALHAGPGPAGLEAGSTPALGAGPLGAGNSGSAIGSQQGLLPQQTSSSGNDNAAAQEQQQQQQQQHMMSSAPGLSLGSASQLRPIPVEVLDAEYDMVHQAFATDSKDQSPWMYYRWLVGNSLAHVEWAGKEVQGPAKEEAVGAARSVLEAVLAREVQRLECDHLALEPDAKWPLLTLARLKEAQVRLGLCGVRDISEVQAEVAHMYRRLQQLDPLRAGYYQDALEGKAFVVVSALGTV